MINKSDLSFLRDENEKKPTEPPRHFISEYAEQKRILPPNTPFPGFWRNSRTPYSVEIMDNLSPYSPVQHTAIMKAAQLGITASAENVVGYWMDESPAEILYISATEGLLETWATKRLEPLIDSCGFRDKVYAQTGNAKSRRTGDKIFTKEYVGGTLNMASAQSASGLRSESKRVLIRDEIDGAPPLLRTGEGNWLSVSYARTRAWGVRKKILDISTPTTMEASLINSLYMEGDQRRFLVPCPYCGTMQPLEFGSESSVHGLKAETEAGQLVQAFYICDHCHEAIFNHQKTAMLKGGSWEPTAKAPIEFRSYHLNSLYSPVGMYSWTDMFQEYLDAKNEPDGMRSFVNLCLGLPFKESGSRPKLEKVVELRGGYSAGTVPDDVLYITAGIDVQTGSQTDKTNPARLEMEILGHGAGYRSFSIDYKVFFGPVADPYSGAWEELNEWAEQTKLTFYTKNGKPLYIVMVFIDSGDGNVTDIVYRFTQRWQNTFPSKGFQALKKRKQESGDQITQSNFKRYRAAKVNEDISLYEISTNYYKNHLYNNLKIERRHTETRQRPGFCDFPLQYGEKYFKMLTVEEKRSDGSFHCPKGARNEALDCRVMAQCAGDVYLDAKVLEIKAAAKAAGATAAQIQQFNHKYVIDLMAKET